MSRTLQTSFCFLLLLVLALPLPSPALRLFGAGGGGFTQTALVIQEEDGTPTGNFNTLKVTNTTMTDNLDGSASVVTGGGGVIDISGTPTTGQLAAWTDANTLEGTSVLSMNITTMDLSGADATTPWTVGNEPPATCAVGQTHFDSNATAGSNILGCTATDTWTVQGGGGSTFSTAVVVTSTANPCLAVGPNGTTNPTLAVDCSVASAATGLLITPAASGSGVTLSAAGGSNEQMTVQAKGNANTVINAPTSGQLVRLNVAGLVRVNVANTFTTFATGARTSGATTTYSFTGGADTALTTGTEAKDFVIDLGQTKQHASNSTIALQRHINFLPPTDTCASATCTITMDALLALTGPPTGGTNSTITSSTALLVETRALTNVTTGYGMVVDAPSGASTNHAAYFRSGTVVVEALKTTGSAGSKNVVCVDVSTGILYASSTGTDCSN